MEEFLDVLLVPLDSLTSDSSRTFALLDTTCLNQLEPLFRAWRRRAAKGAAGPGKAASEGRRHRVLPSGPAPKRPRYIKMAVVPEFRWLFVFEYPGEDIVKRDNALKTELL